MSIAKGMKVLEIFARDWRSFPLSFNLLLVFGVVFVMSMVAGARQPASVAVMCVTLLAAYLAVLLPNRWLFALSADARRLTKFMGLKRGERRIRFCITVFENTPAEDLHGDSFTYSSLPRNDVEAMIELAALLAKHDLLKEARNPLELLIDEKQKGSFDTLVHIGGPRVSGYVGMLVENDSLVSYEHAEKGEAIAITVASGLNRRYAMRPPSPVTCRTDEQTFEEDTYGCVMKRAESEPTRFVIWGLDARGTLAAAHWLAVNWSQLETLYGIGLEESFTAILRVPGRDHYAAKPLRVAYDGVMPLLLPESSQGQRNRRDLHSARLPEVRQ